METETQTVEAIDLKRFLSSMRLNAEIDSPVPLIREGLELASDATREEDRFISGLAALLLNIDTSQPGKFDKSAIFKIIAHIDEVVNDQVNEVLHNAKFQALESSWRGVDDLIRSTNFRAGVMIDLLDASKEDVFDDLDGNAVDIAASAMFKKLYVSEYDQFGGKPYGGLIGLYEFKHTPTDELFLKVMSRVCAASHAPFISSVSTQFFGCETIEELAAIKDLEGLLANPKYSSWNALRDTPEAAYLALTLPRYVLRLPFHPVTNPVPGGFNFTENLHGDVDSEYLWGSSAILFAKNMIRSYATSGWCQYLRGPKGGGQVSGLPVHTFNIRGEDEIKIPVEMNIPDYRELEFANSGFIPLIYRKGTGDACFFSAQSVKKAKAYDDAKDSENAQLVTNISYTFSVTRIAHYVKCIMRDNIGSSADGPYIQNTLQRWISKYVTTVSNPDDLTLRYYPFKAASVQVEARPGSIGFYDCKMAILPHVQFEGMDTELRLDARL
ncbi:MAG: type secretion system contractile sheath large subunit [Pseudomonadota bacterium]|jgi:type VI secretion system protein ImpC